MAVPLKVDTVGGGDGAKLGHSRGVVSILPVRQLAASDGGTQRP
jgi:hypothetical protein